MTASERQGSADHLFRLGAENHRAGRITEAEMLYRQALEIDRDHAESWHALALVAVQSGRPQDALGLFKHALAQDPDNPEFLNNLGMAYLDTGNASRAAKAFARATDLAPRYLEARFNLGVAASRRNEFETAARAFGAVFAAAPDRSDAARGLVGALKRLGRIGEAAAALDRLLAEAPNDPVLLGDRAEAALATGDRDGALAFAARALATAPEDPRRIAHAARVRSLVGDPVGAAREIIDGQRRRLAAHPEDPLILGELSNALLTEGRAEEARAFLDQACARAPDDERLRFNRAVLRQQFGESGAVDEFAALAERPASPVAARAFYAMVDQTPDIDAEDRLARVERWLAEPELTLTDRASLEFAHGRLLDALGRFDAAFAAYDNANALKRSETRWDAAGQTAFVARILAEFDRPAEPAPSAGPRASERPVFVVGMPRSGTTLIEQALGAHPQVHAAGELTYFTELIPRLGARFGRRQPFPEVVAALTPAELEELAAEYLDVLAARDANAARVVDKMPYNFLHVGLLHRLFPRARFLVTTRTPAAIAWSIFSNDFVGRHPYANALDSLGIACANELRLSRHWLERLPAQATEVHYETLVADFERELARVLDFIGLEMAPSCVEFHRQRTVVRTASSWQVRQPLYRSSTDKWRRYEAHLEPFFASLNGAART